MSPEIGKLLTTEIHHGNTLIPDHLELFLGNQFWSRSAVESLTIIGPRICSRTAQFALYNGRLQLAQSRRSPYLKTAQ